MIHSEKLLLFSSYSLTVVTSPSDATSKITYNGNTYTTKSVQVPYNTYCTVNVSYSNTTTKTYSLYVTKNTTLTFNRTYSTSSTSNYAIPLDTWTSNSPAEGTLSNYLLTQTGSSNTANGNIASSFTVTYNSGYYVPANVTLVCSCYSWYRQIATGYGWWYIYGAAGIKATATYSDGTTASVSSKTGTRIQSGLSNYGEVWSFSVSIPSKSLQITKLVISGLARGTTTGSPEKSHQYYTRIHRVQASYTVTSYTYYFNVSVS